MPFLGGPVASRGPTRVEVVFQVDTGVSGSLGALSEAVIGGAAVVNVFVFPCFSSSDILNHSDVHPVPPHSVRSRNSRFLPPMGF